MNPRILLGIGLAAAMATGGSLGVLLARSSGDQTVRGPGAVVTGPASPFEGSVMPRGVRAPDFTLQDERGQQVSMREYGGRPVIVTFLYSTCEESCPLEAQLIRGALDDLGANVPALSISVDPFRDTPASARRFNREQHVAGRVRWVLGSRLDLRPLWRGFAIQPQLRETEHQARITLVDKRGFQRVGWPASQATPESIAHDVRVLLRE